MSTPDISLKIQEILNKRRPNVHAIEQAEFSLTQLHEQMLELERSLKNDQKTTALQIFAESSLKQDIQVALHELRQLKARFSRDTLNIGVIGRARQGKSQLLQSLTGLGNAEIPAADRDHCTGVRSAIYHRAQRETSAKVYYYTETEFLQEVIRPYFIALDLGVPPASLDEFAGRALDIPRENSAEAGAKLNRLKKYQTLLPEYRALLQRPSPQEITQASIPEFVAQYDLNDPSETPRPFYNYLAIREIHIHCPFPNAEVGKIAVIDMPGLGDTGLGDDTRMIEALGQQIDMVLFVRFPKSRGDHWADYDVRLYDTANKALKEIPLNQWAYQILNVDENGENRKNCIDLQHSMSEHHMSVIDALMVNCKSPGEADQKILQPVLAYMSREINRLDRQFAQARQQNLDILRQNVHDLLNRLGRELEINTQPSDHDHAIFRPRFDDFWTMLTTAITDLTRELKEETLHGKDKNFAKGLQEAVEKAKVQNGIPNQAAIVSRQKALGDYSSTYSELLKIVRTTLTGHFQLLDTHLGFTVESAKHRVVDALRHSGLAPLSDKTDVNFLWDMVVLTKNPERFKTMNEAFTHLVKFHLLYRGFVQHRIRTHLDDLSPDSDFARDYQTTAAGIESKLQLLHRMTLEKIEGSLSELLWEPSMAIFAVVEEFQDRILRAEKVERLEWENFMYDHRAEIWASEFRWRALFNKINRTCDRCFLSLSV